MTKHRSAFTIRGTVRDPQDRAGVAGLTVRALDQHLAVDDRLGKAVTDAHGRFELRYAKRDFARVFLEAKPTLYLQLENAAGEVVHISTEPVGHEAAATRGIDLTLRRDVVAAAAIEPTRALYRTLLAINPNYFGAAPQSGLPKLAQLVPSTAYEQLGCIGLSPHDDTLEAVLTVKLPYGYGGELCGPGTREWVSFFIDYDDGRGFVLAGAPVDVRVHDLMATGGGELHYAVRRAFTPDHLLDCSMPQVVRLRAILSWEVPATQPSFVPVWGDVKDAWIQLRPFAPLMPFIPDLALTPTFALFGDLATIKATAEASLAALAVQASSGRVEPERAQLQPLLAKNPNYFGSLSRATTRPQLAEDLAKLPWALAYDPSLLEPVIPLPIAAKKYEELTCVGLYPEHDLLEATFVTKLPYGFSGDPCTTGSVEHVAFYIDFGAGFVHVGTDHVRVYDVAAPDGEPLCFAAKARVRDIAARLRDCGHENVVTVRAVLSWGHDPTPYGPTYVPAWGNVLDRRVQLRPATGPSATVGIELISEIHVHEIAQSGAARGYAYDPGDTVAPLTYDRPFGGIVAVHGNVNVPGATRYRFLVGGDPIRDPRFARNPLFWLPTLERTPDADGWFSIADYDTDVASYSLTPLLHWRTYGKDGLYRLRLELGDASGPMPGQAVEIDLRLDNTGIDMFSFGGALATLPMTGVAVLDAAGQPKKCGEYVGSDTIRVFGNFRDDHFEQWRVIVAGGNLPTSGVLVASGSFPSLVSGVGPTGIVGAGDGSAGQELVAFDLCSPSFPQSPLKVKCAYVVSLTVWDRAIVGSVSGYSFNTTAHSRQAHVTFTWDPAGQC